MGRTQSARMGALDSAIAQAAAPVVIFSFGGCPFCRKVETAFKAAGVPFKVMDFDADCDDGDAVHQDIIAKHKQRSVPAVFVNGKFVGGCNDGPESWMGAMPLLNSGELMR